MKGKFEYLNRKVSGMEKVSEEAWARIDEDLQAHIYMDLDISRQVRNLKKTTKLLKLQDVSTETSVISS